MLLLTRKMCAPSVFISFVCRTDWFSHAFCWVFLNISFSLEVMVKVNFRGGGCVRIAKRGQADHRTSGDGDKM